jgi:hypothetical protein
LNGTALLLQYVIEPLDFDFGRQKIRTRETQILAIENQSLFLPLPFTIKKIAHFRFLRDAGTIKPSLKIEIEVSFLPRNLGDFQISITVDLGKTLEKQNINLIGVAVVHDVEPKKFQRVPIWETNESARFNTGFPHNRYGINMDEIRRKSRLRQEFDGYIAGSVEERAAGQQKRSLRRRIDEIHSLRRSGIPQVRIELLKHYL